MKKVLEQQESLDVKQEEVTELAINNGKLAGVKCSFGNEYIGKAVILTTGTFLNGTIYIGDISIPAGRAGERPSALLANNLKEVGFNLQRLKTGTPPRINGKDVDITKMLIQEGDPVPVPFSFRTGRIERNQAPCYITHTTARTKEIIKDNLNRSPLFSGKITGTGVRYCPSIEDKVLKFPDKETHQVFIEPEGYETNEIYLNGVSTSLPYDVQYKIVRSITGLEGAEIMRPGYAIEYDFAPPTQLKPTLETKLVEFLYFAGQINGTSGYEEAAAQGLMAGINAVRKIRNEGPIVLARSQAYIGVLIDDLVTKGTNEPYRMFTSRAEYRLILRQDNADIRLMSLGHKLGLVDDSTKERLDRKLALINTGLKAVKESRAEGSSTVEKLLRRPELSYRDLREKFPILPSLPPDVVQQIEIETKYSGYIQRQLEDIEQQKRYNDKRIPEAIDYMQLDGLKKEAKQKLQQIRPLSIGQAARISGITPADISVLLIWLEKLRRSQ
jgi:tRNA uridine 5-carboxymethylaminomethyl modification enzyme